MEVHPGALAEEVQSQLQLLCHGQVCQDHEKKPWIWIWSRLQEGGQKMEETGQGWKEAVQQKVPEGQEEIPEGSPGSVGFSPQAMKFF